MNDSGDTSGYIQYKAIYDFDSRNPDELPFKAGDIIMVSFDSKHSSITLEKSVNVLIRKTQVESQGYFLLNKQSSQMGVLWSFVRRIFDRMALRGIAVIIH